MSKYTFTCNMGHEPMTFDVMAEDDDTAMKMMMEKVKPHLAEAHADKPMDDAAIMETIKGGWKKEEAPAA